MAEQGLSSAAPKWRDKFKADLDADGKVVFNLGLTNRDGRDVFDVRCQHCNQEIAPDTKRWLCLDCGTVYFCEECFSEHHLRGQPTKEHDPATHVFGLDVGHYIHAHNDVYVKPHMSVCLHNALVTYANRPFVIPGTAPWSRGTYPASYAAVARISYAFAYSLHSKLPKRADQAQRHVLIYTSENKPQFTYAEFACTFNNDISVPIVPVWTDENLAHVVRQSHDSGLLAAVCADDEGMRRLRPLFEASDQTQLLWVLLDEVTAAPPGDEGLVYDHSSWDTAGVVCLSDLVAQAPRDPAQAVSAVGLSPGLGLLTQPPVSLMNLGNSIWTISYTSGSSGYPKGVMIPCSSACNSIDAAQFSFPNTRVLYCPLAHLQDRFGLLIACCNGQRVVYSSGEHALGDAHLVRPAVLQGPPALFSALYAMYTEHLDSALKQADMSFPEAEAAALSFVRDQLGGKIELLGVGGAKCPPMLLAFLQRVSPSVVDSFGGSEFGGALQNGRPGPGVQVRLEDLPELGLTNAEESGVGELVVQTDKLMAGYFGNEQATSAAFTPDGWYRSGDVARQHADGTYEIIDRVSSSTKLANGEFVNIQSLSVIFTPPPAISTQSCIIADSSLDHPAMICVLGEGNEHDLSRLEAELLKSFRRLFRSSGQSICREFELPDTVVFSHEKWTSRNNLLTPTLKVNVKMVKKTFLEIVLRKRAAAVIAGAQPEDDVIAAVADPFLRQVVIEALHCAQVARDEFESGSALETHSFAHICQSSMRRMMFVQRILNLLGPQRAGMMTSSQLLQMPLQEVARTVSGEASVSSVLEDSRHRERAVLQMLDRDLSTYRMTAAAVRDPPKNRTGAYWECDASEEVVLLTGATGFVGLHCLHAMLVGGRQPQQILVLVRTSERNDQAALGRLRIAWETAFTEIESFDRAVNTGQLKVVGADLELSSSQNLLGLYDDGDESYAQFGNVTCVLHSGARVTFEAPYHELRQANVVATSLLLRYAISNGAAFHLLSTLSVFVHANQNGLPKTERSTLDDTALEAGFSLAAENGYTQTKWVADKIVTSAATHVRGGRREAPICVHRLGYVLWNTQTGMSNTQDYLSRLLISCMVLKAFPVNGKQLLSGALTGLFVDHLAAQVACISMDREAQEALQVFHYHETEPILMAELYDGAAMRSWEGIPYENWHAQVLQTESCPFGPIASMIMPAHGLPLPNRFRNPNTLEILSLLAKDGCAWAGQHHGGLSSMQKHLEHLAQSLAM